MFCGSVIALNITNEETDIIEISTTEITPMMASNSCYTSVNQMQNLINTGHAPIGVTFVHNGFQGQQPHVHFSDGTAMNFDGSAHHGSPAPNSLIMKWLNNNGWCIK